MGTLHQPYFAQGTAPRGSLGPTPSFRGEILPLSPALWPPIQSPTGKAVPALYTKKKPEKSLGKQKLNTDVHWVAQLFPPDDYSLSLLFSSLSPTRSSHAADASTSLLSAPQETLQTKRSSAPCVHSLDEGNRVVPIHPNSSTAFMACSEAKELKETRLPPVMNEGEQ